jgi:hypothetical protein
MNEKELKEILDRLGGSLGGWADTKGGSVQNPFLSKQAELLTQLRDMLQTIQEEDRKKLNELKIQLSRVEHGGGE